MRNHRTFLSLSLISFLFVNSVRADELDKVLNAIQFVESGNAGNGAKDGDGGKAIGPFQIHRSYFLDAAKYDRSLGDNYENCRNVEFARRVVRAYVCRYLKESERTSENIARIHNGGNSNFRGSRLSAAWKNMTKYWNRVKQRMERM